MLRGLEGAIFPRQKLFLLQEESDHRGLKVMTEQIGNASGKLEVVGGHSESSSFYFVILGARSTGRDLRRLCFVEG